MRAERFSLAPWGLLLALVLAIPAVAAAQDTAQDQLLNPFTDLTTYAVGLATAALIGATKRYTGIADTFVWDRAKKLQPLLAVPLAMGLTFAWGKLGLGGAPPDANLFLQAPASAVVGIAAAELSTWFRARVRA